MKKSTIVLAALLMGGMAFGASAQGQPHMKAAMEALETAKSELKQADADKGGYRAKAMNSVDAAMKDVKEGMEYDEKHVDKKEEKKDN